MTGREEDGMEAEKSLWEENIAFWEKWSTDCTTTTFDLMQKKLEEASSFQTEIDKAGKAAFSTQVSIALAAIKVLECQIETLSNRVDELTRKNG
jgi:hypothetical protein